MAKLSAITTPSLTFDEGAAPSTPSANDVIIYAKSDGLVYSKDDAGTETLMSSGSASSGVPSGTSNPGSPGSGDLFFRTDLGYLIYYNGTRWLTVQEYTSAPSAIDPNGEFPFASNSRTMYAGMHGVDRDIWLVKWFCTTTTLTTNNGTNFWTVTLQDSAGTDIATFTTGSGPDTANVKTNHEVAIGALLGTTSPDDLWIEVLINKTLSPGNLYVISLVTYRLVVT